MLRPPTDVATRNVGRNTRPYRCARPLLNTNRNEARHLGRRRRPCDYWAAQHFGRRSRSSADHLPLFAAEPYRTLHECGITGRRPFQFSASELSNSPARRFTDLGEADRIPSGYIRAADRDYGCPYVGRSETGGRFRPTIASIGGQTRITIRTRAPHLSPGLPPPIRLGGPPALGAYNRGRDRPQHKTTRPFVVQSTTNLLQRNQSVSVYKSSAPSVPFGMADRIATSRPDIAPIRRTECLDVGFSITPAA